MFSCTKSLGTVAVVSNVKLMPKLVSSPRVGGQIANSRAVSSPCNHGDGKYEIKGDKVKKITSSMQNMLILCR